MIMKQIIYCVEDDINIRELIEYTLQQSGFDFCGFENSADFFKKLSEKKPDLILLDIMLPDKDGISILKELRISPLSKQLPIIMLTAKSGQLDKIKGLDSGADDYITKPFDVLELISRIKALLRRTERNESVLKFKNINVHQEKRIVTVNSKIISLTYKEYELLCLLIQNTGIVIDRQRIMNEIWGVEFEGETRTVDVHIGTLRQKLGSSGNCIETVRNVGYRIG